MSPILLLVVRVVLVVEVAASFASGAWPQLAVAAATLALTYAPERVARFFGVRLPPSFLTMIAGFIFATLFLGEVANFYERFWWWDLVLHFGSAVSFGLFAFLFIFMLFEGDRYGAPPWAIGFLSACVAIAIGVVWEIFEFAMDQSFGLNMQKSGLMDTMGDLIVDLFGAAVGGLSGFLYLKGIAVGGPHGLIDEFISSNRRLYRRVRRR